MAEDLKRQLEAIYHKRGKKQSSGSKQRRKHLKRKTQNERTGGLPEGSGGNRHEFHNPYHFVPVTELDETQRERCEWKSINTENGGRVDRLTFSELGNATHDRYTAGAYGGRIVCRLTARTPLFVGGRRWKKATEDNPAEVEPFTLGGYPAIPASTLRGVISSIAEAASQSAMRVLENRSLSHRFSAIWRHQSGGDVHDYFRIESKELLPFHATRERLSPAELLFGFVEERVKGTRESTKDQKRAFSYAGRVRFSNALLEKPADNPEDHYLPECILKILATPKPPSPALYFRNRNDPAGYIAKKDLNIERHAPQGRKFYLHHPQEQIDGEEWKTHPDNETKNLKQKTRIRPIRAESSFCFRVDFENLSEYQLGLLCYALKPNEAFCHKIGMGKPLGLGTVNIEPIELKSIDRMTRYCQDPFANNERYEVRTDLIDSAREKFRANTEGITPGLLEIVERLGDPGKLMTRVHYPQIGKLNGVPLNQSDMENKHYRWWIANDKGSKAKWEKLRAERKHLEPLDSTIGVPTLRSFDFLQKKK